MFSSLEVQNIWN